MSRTFEDRLVDEARQSGTNCEAARLLMLATARQRQEGIFSLHVLRMSIRQIAARLGCSPAVIQSALKTAKGSRPDTTRRDERVSYELHVELAHLLRREPERIKAIAQANLQRMRETSRNSLAVSWLDAWEDMLDLPVDELERRMLDDSELALELRQMSPFAGALSQDERSIAIRKAAYLAAQ